LEGREITQVIEKKVVGDEQMINMYESTQSLTAELINFFFYGILTKKSEDK